LAIKYAIVRRWVARLSAFLLVLVAGIGCFIFVVHLEIRQFDNRTAEPQILGKTPEQVISVYGTPYSDTADERDYTGNRVILLEGPWWERCRIEFTGGVAISVRHYSQ
jgi:hypothetical protein